MIKTLALGLIASGVLAVTSPVAKAAADFFGNGFIVLNINGLGNTFYDLNPPANTLQPDFNGTFLGTFDPSAGQSLVLTGGEFNTFQDNGDNVASVNLNYRITLGAPTGNFSSFSIDFISQAGNDKFWQTTDENVVVLSGLAPGTYSFQVFGSADTTAGPRFYSDNGNNYTATFTIVPEPSSFALLGGPALLGAWMFIRRRRS